LRFSDNPTLKPAQILPAGEPSGRLRYLIEVGCREWHASRVQYIPQPATHQNRIHLFRPIDFIRMIHLCQRSAFFVAHPDRVPLVAVDQYIFGKNILNGVERLLLNIRDASNAWIITVWMLHRSRIAFNLQINSDVWDTRIVPEVTSSQSGENTATPIREAKAMEQMFLLFSAFDVSKSFMISPAFLILI